MQEQNSHISAVLEYISVFVRKVNITIKDDLKQEITAENETEISSELLLKSIETLTQQLQSVCEKIKTELNGAELDDLQVRSAKEISGSEQLKNTDHETNPLDPNIVQIKASNAEIERRIAAFLDQKQNEVNEFNRREFCSLTQLDERCSEGCARTDAVFIPRAGTRSHIKVTRVVNPYGPQTRHNDAESNQNSSLQSTAGTGLQCMHERLRNMENHLDMTEETSKADMFRRLKMLEERILYLESLSPEYFQNAPPPAKRKHRKVNTHARQHDHQMNITLSDIDARIQGLKAVLKQQSCGDSFD